MNPQIVLLPKCIDGTFTMSHTLCQVLEIQGWANQGRTHPHKAYRLEWEIHINPSPSFIFPLLSYFTSVQFSRSVVSDSLRPHELQYTRPPCPSPTPGVYPNPCALSLWCHPTTSSSVIHLSSCLQSFPASESFPMSQFFASGGQNIGVSALASVLPKNHQDWSPLEWTGWISLQSMGLSRVFSNTTVQKHQFFGAQLFFTVQLIHPYMTTGKTIALTRRT